MSQPRMKPKAQPLTRTAAQEGYLSDAAYYWLRAVGPDENMMSALHRLSAMRARETLQAHGWAIPTPREVYNRAVAIFGVDRCHEEPQP